MEIRDNLCKLLDWYLKINSVVLGSNAQRLKSHAVCIMQDLLRKQSIHVAVRWPRLDEDGQISEELPLGGTWREKDSYEEF